MLRKSVSPSRKRGQVKALKAPSESYAGGGLRISDGALICSGKQEGKADLSEPVCIQYRIKENGRFQGKKTVDIVVVVSGPFHPAGVGAEFRAERQAVFFAEYVSGGESKTESRSSV